MEHTNDWHKVCITDNSGKEFFKCTACPSGTMSEIRNLQRHIKQAKKAPHMYKMLDVESAIVLLDGLPYDAPVDMDLDALLAELDA